jgi:hypothetical protein
MSSITDFENTVKKEREILKLMKKKEQEKRKSLRKAARTLKKKVSAVRKTARALEREKTRKARQNKRDAARKTRKLARGKKASKVTLNVLPGETLKDYVKKSPHFKRPKPSARQRALELTVGQGMDVTPEMLKEIEEAQRVKTDEEELEELEKMIEADEAANEYVNFMAQQPSPTLSDIEEDMMGGKRRKRRGRRRKSKKNKKNRKKSKKTRKYTRRR